MSTLLALRVLLFAGEMFAASALIMTLTRFAAVQRNASARHISWVCAFGALLVLPVLVLLVPSAVHIVLSAPAPVSLALLVHVGAIAPALAAPAPGTFSLDPLIVATAAGVLWLAGVCVVAVRFGVSEVCLVLLKRRSRPYAVPPDALPCVPATRRECELRLSDRNDGPVTWGIFRPVILLPKTAILWPRDRLHAVLMHELAHIRRRDSLAQLLSFIVCALYWPNPLVWRGAGALRREAEMAADDAAIVSGFKPSKYAVELLGLAAEFRARLAPFSPIPLSMAAPSALKARVESVLSATSLRSGVRSMDVMKIAGLGLLATGALALARPSLAQEMPPPPAPSAVVTAPEAPPAPPAPRAPEMPPAPPAPPARPAPVEAAAPSVRIMIDEHGIHRLTKADVRRLHAAVAQATREARKAIDETRVSREAATRAVEEARPQIDAAVAEVERARPQIDAAMNEVKKARPEIERALQAAKPEIDAALAKVRSELVKERLDANIRVRVDEALQRAEIRLEAAQKRASTNAIHESRPSDENDDTVDTPEND